MKIFTVIFIALTLSACGGLANSANNTNSKSSNGSSASPSPSGSLASDKETGADLAPTTMSVSEFMTYYDKANEGRIVTVEGARLEEISYSSLSLRDGSGYGFSCGGSFSEYMEMKTRIDDLRYKNQSPIATVKGIYTEGTNGKPALKSCILTDIKKWGVK